MPKTRIIKLGQWTNQHRNMILIALSAVVVGATIARIALLISGSAACQ